MTLFHFLCRAAVLTAFAAATSAMAQGPTPAPAPARVPAAPRPVSADRSVLLDRVVAVVNDEALTQFEIDEQKRTILAQMKSQNVTPPAPDVLEKQLLDRLITERAIMQFAKENGVKVDDTQVERAILRIAQDNKLSPDEFRVALKKEGIEYEKYREDIRKEIVIQRLRDREVDSRVTVSDSEVEAYLASQSTQGGDLEYRISHILVIVPERASPEQIEAKRRRAEEALKSVREGTDFAQVAAGYSDAPDALQGGSLGWRPAARLPNVFVEAAKGMKPGDVSTVLRSATGFHIVKLQETRNRNAPTVVEQTRARHILIKVNEVTSESDGKARIDRIRDRLETGSKFEDQAKLNSEDGTASKGGDLGWLSPGDTVPDFENAMNKLKISEISVPVRTQFGWHLIQVQERRTQDITAEKKRDQARMALRQRKSDEAFQDWLRQMRDRAYVEIKPAEQ
jgi:peptidyl-prolyl cis-trans isomerase SurA